MDSTAFKKWMIDALSAESDSFEDVIEAIQRLTAEQQNSKITRNIQTKGGSTNEEGTSEC